MKCVDHGTDYFTGCPWCQLEVCAEKHAQLKAASQHVLETIATADREGIGDRTVEENDALDQLRLTLTPAPSPEMKECEMGMTTQHQEDVRVLTKQRDHYRDEANRLQEILDQLEEREYWSSLSEAERDEAIRKAV